MKMVIFGHRRGGVQPPKTPEITFFKVKFSNSRGGGVRTPGPPLWIRACALSPLALRAQMSIIDRLRSETIDFML